MRLNELPLSCSTYDCRRTEPRVNPPTPDLRRTSRVWPPRIPPWLVIARLGMAGDTSSSRSPQAAKGAAWTWDSQVCVIERMNGYMVTPRLVTAGPCLTKQVVILPLGRLELPDQDLLGVGL